MLKELSWLIKAFISLTFLVLNTLIMCTLVFCFALLKAIIPIKAVRSYLTTCLIKISERWIYNNNALFGLTQTIEWDIEGLETFDANGRYMVICNHQSWIDIFVLQKVLTGHIPFLKFFLKQELIWVPVIGIAWWALDFPFMRRYSKSYIEKNPELKSKDIATTRTACKKFKDHPVSIMNFIEGTRNTPQKHLQQQSPYKHLLKPKAGGLAYVFSAMGEQLQSIVDVTIIYPEKQHSFMDFMCGRITKVIVRISNRDIPSHLISGDYQNDIEFRSQFQSWVTGLWIQKDEEITLLQDKASDEKIHLNHAVAGRKSQWVFGILKSLNMKR